MLSPCSPLQLRTSGGPGPTAEELAPELSPNESVHSSDLVSAPQGLFPAPLPPAERGRSAKVGSSSAAWILPEKETALGKGVACFT